MIVERVLLIRHGQTDWNMEGRWQGILQVPLNQDGWAQARALAAFLRGRPIGAIFSSDLARAWQTATVLGETLGVQPEADQRLREFNLGVFQGHTRDELPKIYPVEWNDFRANYWDYLVPQGETRRQLQERMYAAWLDIVARPVGPEVALVSHGGSLKVLLLKLFGDVPEVTELVFENTSVTTLERVGDHWHLVGAAAVTHLAKPMPTQNDTL